MKRFNSILLICFTAILLVLTGCPKSPAKTTTEMPSFAAEGAKLIYHVDYFGDEYDFIVDLKKIGKDIEFDWSMTSPVNSSGSVEIKEKALKNATYLFNYFSDGDNIIMYDSTTVFMSKAVYNALKKNETVTIDAGDGDENLSFDDYEDFPVIINGEEKNLYCIYSSSDLFGWFWILDNQSFPLILKMDIGWTITLTEIVTE
ncbi:MAG: hypothetical protein PHW02_00855 [bacterium]|nr:hypothetical protein [bacterium]